MELQGNYEKLANAIIFQAVKDYRTARKYLKKHPHTKELDAIVAAQAEKRRIQAEERKAQQKSGQTVKESQKRKLTREERLLHRIISAESMVSEVSTFLLSGWYGTLTSVDGEMLLKRLRAE